MGRRVMTQVSAKSTLLRCTGASTNAPSAGTFSAPTTVTRPSSLEMMTTSPRTTPYQNRVVRLGGPVQISMSSPGRGSGTTVHPGGDGLDDVVDGPARGVDHE